MTQAQMFKQQQSIPIGTNVFCDIGGSQMSPKILLSHPRRQNAWATWATEVGSEAVSREKAGGWHSATRQMLSILW